MILPIYSFNLEEIELRQALEDYISLRKGIERSVLIDEIEVAKGKGRFGKRWF